MTVAIWGSCVTRDTFEIGGSWEGRLSYHARSSWISQAATASRPPVDVPEGTGFGHRMVREDLTKAILTEAVAAQPDVVIFDLIDERFDIVEISGSRFSVNDYYPRLELEEPMRKLSERTIPFRETERDTLFAQAVLTLADQWMHALPQARFVLHRAWYTARSADPVAHPFYASAPTHVRWCNERLARHYAALHDAFGDRLHVVEPDADVHLVGDPGHKWGLAHFHYVPSYYEACLDQIRAISAGASPEPRPLAVPTHEQSGALPPEGSATDPGGVTVRGLRRAMDRWRRKS